MLPQMARNLKGEAFTNEHRCSLKEIEESKIIKPYTFPSCTPKSGR